MFPDMLKNILLCAVIAIAIDAPYLYLTKNTYLSATKNISGSGFTNRLYSAVLVYIAIGLALTLLVLPKINSNASWDKLLIQCFMYGGVFGLTSYAIFNFTVHFMFKNWSLGLSIQDTTWGTILCTLITFVLVSLQKYIK